MKFALLLTLCLNLTILPDCFCQTENNQLKVRRINKWINTTKLMFDCGTDEEMTRIYKQRYKDILEKCERINKSTYSIPLKDVLQFQTVRISSERDRTHELVFKIDFFYKKGNYSFDDLLVLTEFVLNSTIDSLWSRDRIVMKLAHVFGVGRSRIEIVSEAYPNPGKLYWVDSHKNYESNRGLSKINQYVYDYDRSEIGFIMDPPSSPGFRDVANYMIGVPISIKFSPKMKITMDNQDDVMQDVFNHLIKICKPIAKADKVLHPNPDDRILTLRFLKGEITPGYWESVQIELKKILKQGSTYIVTLDVDGDFYPTKSTGEPSEVVFDEECSDIYASYSIRLKSFSYNLKTELTKYLAQL